MKKLTKSPNNRVISGVCGGLGEYFGIDPTVVRLIWALFILFGGSGVLIYVLCMLFMPEGNVYYDEVYTDDDRKN
ncbi:MAG: PspC domain-containing protein [Firmicutes bacterium]|nr:PspC domain-containing protein [Bacillota bacterium]